jgi:hypothetical protein
MKHIQRHVLQNMMGMTAHGTATEKGRKTGKTKVS